MPLLRDIDPETILRFLLHSEDLPLRLVGDDEMTTTTEQQYDDDEMDALTILQVDASDRAGNAEQTARAFRAIVTLTEVLGLVVDGRAAIVGSDALVEHLGRLLSAARDYYAMNPSAHA